MESLHFLATEANCLRLGNRTTAQEPSCSCAGFLDVLEAGGRDKGEQCAVEEGGGAGRWARAAMGGLVVVSW